MEMLRKRRMGVRIICVVVAALLVVAACYSIGWYVCIPWFFDWPDPKQSAIDQTRQYVDASYAHPQKPDVEDNPVLPGYEWPHYCWELFHEPAIESANQYTLTVTYYNWEDGGSFGASGADEITVLVEFANGRQVVSYFRAGVVKYCYLSDWSEDNDK